MPDVFGSFLFFRKPLGFLKKVPFSPDFLVAGEQKSLR